MPLPRLLTAAILICLLTDLAQAQPPPKPKLPPSTEPSIGKAVMAGGGKSCDPGQKVTLHPMGFSKKGAFAYFIRTCEGENHLWRFVIVDLVRDRRLFSISVKDRDNDMMLKTFAFKNRDTVAKALKRHGINHRVTGDLASLHSIKKDMGVHFLSAQDKKKKDFTRHDMYVRVPKFGEKRVSSFLIPGDRRGCQVLGAYQSPYEPRLAILVLHQAKASKGGVNCQISVVGAHLEAGF